MNSQQYRILIPLTEEASCYFGMNTEWCTAATNSHNYFNSYNKDGRLYIILEKKTNTRWQYHIQSGSFMDENDSPINVENFYKTHHEAAKAIAEDVVKNNNLEKISDDLIIIQTWEEESYYHSIIKDCIKDMDGEGGGGGGDVMRYYKNYIDDDFDGLRDMDFSISYSNGFARELLIKLQKQHEEIFTKLGQYFHYNFRESPYDVSKINGIIDLVDEMDVEDFKNIVLDASRTGQEIGAQNEAINIFKNTLSKNPYLYWKIGNNNWVGEFQWDVPIAFAISIDEMAQNLDKLSQVNTINKILYKCNISDMVESLNAKINITEPYYGFTDFDNDAAYEIFVEGIQELI